MNLHLTLDVDVDLKDCCDCVTVPIRDPIVVAADDLPFYLNHIVASQFVLLSKPFIDSEEIFVNQVLKFGQSLNFTGLTISLACWDVCSL